MNQYFPSKASDWKKSKHKVEPDQRTLVLFSPAATRHLEKRRGKENFRHGLEFGDQDLNIALPFGENPP
jgi:hypothetical protein